MTTQDDQINLLCLGKCQNLLCRAAYEDLCFYPHSIEETLLICRHDLRKVLLRRGNVGLQIHI